MCDDKSFVRSAALRVYKGPSGAGKTEIPVKGNGTENANAFFISLCLSYGNFTGSTEGAGAAAAALSVVNTVSLERQPGTFSNLNSQFSIGASVINCW